MYSDVGFEPRNIGDVDVIRHNGLFHLFHLVLPNHDFIAHAVSEDGFNWRRVNNALFIGEPGEWDDDALWTMNVSRDPDRPSKWRMFYTGLARRERGRVQRIGCAVSDDLYSWRKLGEPYPLDVAEGEGPLYYESSLDEGRQWVSFRDPLFYHDDGRRLLLASGRVKHGPLIRRGCVAVAEETERDQFEFRPPLHWPRIYDDVEVPSLFKLEGRYFLLGSIREDVKVRYWFSDQIDGPWENYFDNVLLPQGNYAARTCYDRDTGKRYVFNFFFTGSRPKEPGNRKARNLLPPPKELVVAKDGRLMMQSFGGFSKIAKRTCPVEDLLPLEPIMGNPKAVGGGGGLDCWFGAETGFEIFTLAHAWRDFRMSGTLHLDGRGKCGLVFRMDPATTSGYFLSLDLIKGLAQLRAWGECEGGLDEGAFTFAGIQSAYFISDRKGPWKIELVAYGQYLEFSVDGKVVLTLVDDVYAGGRMGFYVETAKIHVDHLTVEPLQPPQPEIVSPHADDAPTAAPV